MALPEGKYGRLTAMEASRLGYLPAKVYVNGEEVLGCSEFDDVEGWADVYAYDERGRAILNESGLGVKTVRIRGVVEYYPNGIDRIDPKD